MEGVAPLLTGIQEGPIGRPGQSAEEWLEERGMTLGDLYGPTGLPPFLHTALLTFGFLHAKNVVLRDVVPPAVPERLRRARARRARRRGQAPEERPDPVRYKTLDIEPVTTLLRHEGRVEQVGLKRALHLTRGHFAVYGGVDEATGQPRGKLFGKQEGLFWRPAHVRGDASGASGRIEKDYRVQRPEPVGRPGAAPPGRAAGGTEGGADR